MLAAAGGAATFLWGRFCERRAKGKRVTLTLTLAEKTLAVEGLVDTANLLRDPISGKAVVLLDRRAADALLPPPLLRATEGLDQSAVAALEGEWMRRVRWIPANTATGHGLLLAISPDLALLDAGRGQAAVELLIAPMALSADLGECRALLPAELIVE